MTARDWGLACAAAAMALDQGTKLLLLYVFGFRDLAPGQAVEVLPFFNLVMTWNPGVSYGLFPASGPWGTALLALFSLAAVIGLGWWMWQSTRRILSIGLGLVIGGALGNLVDRLIYGKVADFFHFHAFAYGWYVFNVADAAITFGVIALLYDAMSRPQTHAGKKLASLEYVMQFRSRHLLPVVLLAGVSLGMAGCESIRAAAGAGKEPPDEFAVVTKAPLVIPPDYNLHPPAPGSAATNQLEPSQTAQSALFGADAATVAAAMPATMSQGERYLLANANVQNADPAIRQEIAGDAAATRGADDSFTNSVLFGGTSSNSSTPVDADAEARRIAAQRAGTTPTTPPAVTPPPPATTDSGSNDDDSGWLGHLWPF